jgi:hypothetical protein
MESPQGSPRFPTARLTLVGVVGGEGPADGGEVLPGFALPPRELFGELDRRGI